MLPPADGDSPRKWAKVSVGRTVMRSSELLSPIVPLHAALCVTAARDQGTTQSTKPAEEKIPATSSYQKEPHPEQPTGKPQCGEVPPGGPAPSGR